MDSWVWITIFGFALLLLLIVTWVILLMYKRRNIQPLKKRSPLLLIVSVIGNYLCMLNVLILLVYFQMFKKNQMDCYCKDPTQITFDDKAICFARWITGHENGRFWKQFTDLNGLMVLNFSEIIIIFPYLLRSLRIKKMFEAREQFYMTEKIPKKMIAQWDEKRILKIFLPAVFVFAIIAFTFGLIKKTYAVIPNYNALSIPAWDCGQFDLPTMRLGFSINNTYISFFSFIQTVLLVFALNS